MEVRRRSWTWKGKRKTCWIVDYIDPATGERVRTTLKGVTGKDDAQAAGKIIYEAAVKAWRDGTTMAEQVSRFTSLGTLLEEYRARPGVSESTRQMEKNQAGHLTRLLHSYTLLTQLGAADLDYYLETRQSDRRSKYSGAPISNATIKKELALLNRAIRWGMARRVVDIEPLPLPEMAVERKRPRCLTRAEIRALFDALGSDDNDTRQAAEVCYLAGLRRSELFRMAWHDIDLKAARLSVPTHKRGRSGERRIDTVYLPDRAVNLLKRRKQAKKPATDALVFGLPTYKWQGVTTNVDQNFAQALRSAARRAGIERPKQIGVHTLRHCCASHLLEAGATVPEVAAHLRHRDGGALLLRTYAHTHETGLRKAGNLLG